MKKYFRDVKDNAVIQFILSYLLVLMLTFLCCTAGFHRAFQIVERNLIEENDHLLRQGAGHVDEFFSTMRDAGLKLSSSTYLKQLGSENSREQKDYNRTVAGLLDEYRQMLLYLEDWSGDVFVYINNLDRILYNSSVYQPEVFKPYLEKWGISEADWEKLCHGSEMVPYTLAEDGTLLFVYPGNHSIQNEDRSGVVFFRMEEAEVLHRMDFLKKYSVYSFFTVWDGQVLVSEDGLGCATELEEKWLREEGNYNLDGKLVLNLESENIKNRNYILVIPQQDAMRGLRELQIFVWMLIFGAALIGVGIAIFFSVRSGRPINRLADMLKENNRQISAGDFEMINDTVSQMIQDQKKSQIALQKNFFHNLLKADFLSKAEMEYMAGKVNLQLRGDIYYAAALRLFPRIDADSIDGQTVEQARNLQTLTGERMEDSYGLPMWSYKRNTLETMYVIEVTEEESLLEVLTDIVLWLRTVHHVDAYWGIGTPCDDLMNFWKSAEEAVNALRHNEKEDAVCMYSHIIYTDENWYLPYSVEEQLMQGLRTGDKKTVESALAIIREENFVRRTIGRKQFLKLHQGICDILAQQLREAKNYEEQLLPLSSHVMEASGNYQGYFSELKTLCYEICENSEKQKSKKRNEKIKGIVEFMEENFADPGMGLGMVSEHCKLSEGYLSALFKEEMNINFADYLETMRIEKACSLLTEGELVALVAEKTGYNSVQSFRRAFKRVKGISPSEYRG